MGTESGERIEDVRPRKSSGVLPHLGLPEKEKTVKTNEKWPIRLGEDQQSLVSSIP